MITIVGHFKNNKIISPDGTVTSCFTYGSVKRIIHDKDGVFNLDTSRFGDLIIKQWILLEEAPELLCLFSGK